MSSNSGVKWDWYDDGITKARVFTLTADGTRWSAASHIDYHGIQVFGERRPMFKGGPKVQRRYFPVICTGLYGEEQHSYGGEGFKFVADAKEWAVSQARELGMIGKARAVAA